MEADLVPQVQLNVDDLLAVIVARSVLHPGGARELRLRLASLQDHVRVVSRVSVAALHVAALAEQIRVVLSAEILIDQQLVACCVCRVRLDNH